jgi:phenylacetic acid degradation operon negative regulatory protein
VVSSALSARSVLASVLLGSHPPRLPSWALVAAGELFDINEGAVRTALSRMAASGELRAVDGSYELTGALLDRQSRQDRSRATAVAVEPWNGSWVLAVVRDERRDAGQRGELRTAMARLHFGPLRDGVWTRPATVALDSDDGPGAVVVEQCRLFRGEADGDAGALASELWDLDGWAAVAADLIDQIATATPALEAGDPSGLRDGFVLSAAVLRQFLADPSLPTALLPHDWPGQELRTRYDRFDAAYRAVLQSWLRGRLSV